MSREQGPHPLWAEVERLRAERVSLELEVEQLATSCDELRAQRDAALEGAEVLRRQIAATRTEAGRLAKRLGEILDALLPDY